MVQGVRKLAESSSNETKDIDGRIRAIQQRVNEVAEERDGQPRLSVPCSRSLTKSGNPQGAIVLRLPTRGHCGVPV